MTTRMPLRRERACGLKGGPKRSRLPAHLRRGSAIGGRKPSRLAWAVDAEFRAPKQSSSATALKCLPYRRSWVMKSCPFVNRNPRAGLAAALNVLKIPFRVFSSTRGSRTDSTRAPVPLHPAATSAARRQARNRFTRSTAYFSHARGRTRARAMASRQTRRATRRMGPTQMTVDKLWRRE
jgi:hypothetical protein